MPNINIYFVQGSFPSQYLQSTYGSFLWKTLNICFEKFENNNNRGNLSILYFQVLEQKKKSFIFLNFIQQFLSSMFGIKLALFKFGIIRLTISYSLIFAIVYFPYLISSFKKSNDNVILSCKDKLSHNQYFLILKLLNI